MFYMNHLHPVKSTVFYFMWQRLFYTRPLLLYPTYMHFMFFSATVPVHVNHLHPVQSLFFYFTWQQFLQYIYSQHAASTVFYAYSIFICLSTTVPVYVTSTWRLRDVYGTPFLPLCTIYNFSAPSLTYNGGNECTATLHSSDRDPTLRLQLHFANILVIISAELTKQ